MAEGLALGRGERSRHVARTLAQFMADGQAGLCRHHAALHVVVEWKFFLVVARIPRLNMADDLAKEMPRNNKRAQRNPVQFMADGLAGLSQNLAAYLVAVE